MSRTPEERRATNRLNAAKSTGPKTEAGKDRSRRNAVKHGLRAETLPLPGEDPEAVAGRARAWNDYYRPDSPAAQHLVNQCARATLMADRCQTYHDAVVGRQVREAGLRWDEARDDEVERLVTLLDTDPGAAVIGLRRTSHGCAYLIGRWEELTEVLDDEGWWTRDEWREAIRLSGDHDEPARIRESPEAWHLWLLGILSRPEPDRADILMAFDARHIPDVMRVQFDPKHLPAPDEARAALQARIAERLDRLKHQRDVLEEAYDAPDRAEAPARSLVIQDPVRASLFLRYQAEARTTFHRSFRALTETLERDREALADLDDDDPIEAGAGTAAGTDGPADDPPSPNEATDPGAGGPAAEVAPVANAEPGPDRPANPAQPTTTALPPDAVRTSRGSAGDTPTSPNEATDPATPRSREVEPTAGANLTPAGAVVLERENHGHAAAWT